MQIFFSLFVFGEVWRSKEKEVTLSSISINNKIMTYIETEIPGVWIIEPKIFFDPRGYFMEAFKQQEFDATIGQINFIQDNESQSSFGTLRGLHYQKGAYIQAKLVRVIKGEVLDVAVDLRKSSPTFGKHISVLLSDENKRQLFIPRGFAHGFAVLSEIALFQYKCDNFYHPEADAGINIKDESLGIDWKVPVEHAILSEKDLKHACLKDASYDFDINNKLY